MANKVQQHISSIIIMLIVRSVRETDEANKEGGGGRRSKSEFIPSGRARPRPYLVGLTPCGHSTRPPVFTAIIKCKLIFRNCQILAVRSFGRAARCVSREVGCNENRGRRRGGGAEAGTGARRERHWLLAPFHPFSNNNPSSLVATLEMN